MTTAMTPRRRAWASRPSPRQLLRAASSSVVVLVMSTLLVGVLASSASAETLPAGFSVTAEPSGTRGVVEVAYAPDGRRFLAFKDGRVRTLHPDGRVTLLLDLSARVNSYSDRGLLGIAADKDFSTNGWLYVLFSQELNPTSPDGSGPMTSALTRVTVRADSTVADPTSVGAYVLGSQGQQPCPMPADTLDCMPSDHYWHTIGTVRVDPADGTLWVGSGDAHASEIDATSYRTFDETNTVGKILHVDRNGRGLPGHPFCPEQTDLTRTCTKVYAEGFRNPFRFSLRPGKGPVVGDVGFGGHEEIDLVQPGRNYGWPCYEGPVRYTLHQSNPTCQALYAQEGTAAGASGPAWHYPHGAGAAVIGGPTYTGNAYPADMRGDIFVADYVQGWVKRLDVDSQDRVTGVHDFASGWTGVSLHATPSGDIGYIDAGWASGTPGVRTYQYAGATNAPPTAAATATPSSGAAPLTVRFSSTGSSDPEGGALTYDWDFGDGSAHDTTASPQHVYTSQGRFTATLTVRDPQGAPATATAVVTVGTNSSPTVSITAPTADHLYSGGARVDLAGSATDAEDGTLDGSRLSWQVLLRHNTHLHELTTSTGTTSSFVPVTDHDADSEYEIRLTATDSTGATATAVRIIKPRTIQLTLASSLPGVPLSYEGTAVPAPHVLTAAVGFRATIEAPATYVSNGVTYEFAGWSDGGAARHVVDVPGSNTTLTASYTTGSPAPTETLPFAATADTYVASADPATSFGGHSRLWADASPQSWSLARFQVAGLSGRAVSKVVLRIHETDASASGGRVRAVSGSWSEATTWNTRPTLGTVHATLDQPVSTGNWYEIELPASVVTQDGAIDLGFDTLSTDGHAWASRHTTTPPQLLVTVSSGAQPPPPPPPATETISFTPTADTYVDSAAPTGSYGTSSRLRSDASPESWALARFQVQGLTGRTVTKVVLRAYETDASNSGGRVRAVTGSWSEATTWNTRPTLGTVHATLDQPVSTGNWYEIELPASVVTQDGAIDLGFDTLSTDAHVWASRHTTTAPQLLVTVSSDPAPPPPTTQVLSFNPAADTYVSSANPTVSYGTHSRLWADAAPETWSLSRFDVQGLAGRAVTKVVLRVYETDASPSGGRVRAVTGTWSESTTWDSRPVLGTVHASLDQAVTAGNWYEIELPASLVTGDGPVNLGMDSLSGDGHAWASRHGANPPQLLITVTG